MFIAEEKRKTNIIEYILYMWQLENILRTCQFDIELIKVNVINQQGLNENEKDLEVEWYNNLIKDMKAQNLQQTGHLLITKELISELTLLHQTLLKNFKDNQYNTLYNNARADIYDLQKKQVTNTSEIEACLVGLYGLWLLKIGKKEISAETLQSFDRITKLMSRLAKNYHEIMKSTEVA